ncbi:MAG: threonine synthase [Gemmatimonadales bacterium]
MTVPRCDACAMEDEESTMLSACRGCGGLLSLEQGTPGSTGRALREDLDEAWRDDPGGSGVWRYRQLVLPSLVGDPVSHPEGNTPLLARRGIAEWCGAPQLIIKHEGHNPTGSFKDRGMTVAVTQARRVGATAVACASTGNTSASLASYAAHAGIPALVFVPEGKVAPGKLAQTAAHGAQILVLDGNFDDCLRLAREAADQLGIMLLNSINPFRIEGQKTIIFEMLQQLRWTPPDWIIFPAGNLGNAAAFGKALREALRWGLITKTPRLAAVQAAGAAPFAAAFERGFDKLVPVVPDTVATAIRIGHPASYQRAVRAIRDTGGVVCAVDDISILEAKDVVDQAGVGCEPASAAAIAGLRLLVGRGTIAPTDRVVAVLTGHLLKDPAPAAGASMPTTRITPSIDALSAILGRATVPQTVAPCPQRWR